MDPYGEPFYQALSHDPVRLSQVERAERYAIRLLPFIPRGLPVFQSHGIGHSRAIIRHLNCIFTIPGLSPSTEETALLYMAAWFHDLGYLHPESVYNRGTHADLSGDMIRRDPVIRDLVVQSERQALDTVVRCHDSRADLTRISNYGSDHRVSLMAALFRLADAADIGTDRCPPEVFALIEDGLDEHSRRHWLAHQNVLGCRVAYPFIRILVHDLQNPFFSRRILPHLEEDCRSTGMILQRYGFSQFSIVCRRNKAETVQIASSLP